MSSESDSKGLAKPTNVGELEAALLYSVKDARHPLRVIVLDASPR